MVVLGKKFIYFSNTVVAGGEWLLHWCLTNLDLNVLSFKPDKALNDFKRLCQE